VTQSWDYPTKSWWTHQPILQPKVEHSFCNIVNKVFNKNQNSTINIVTQSWDYPSKSQTLILRYRNKSCEIIRVKNQSSTTNIATRSRTPINWYCEWGVQHDDQKL
jgi:hypothetical protein